MSIATSHSEHTDLMADFSAALERVSSGKRASMIASLAELFAAIADQIGDTEVELFDALFLPHLRITDHDTLMALSKRFATIPNAPPNLIRALAANDSVAIAGPVLSCSQALATADLVRYAATRGQDHLHAICRRAEIPPVLSSVLVTRGGRSLLDRLALTSTANFFAADFARLIRRASLDERGRAKVNVPARLETPGGHPITGATILNISATGSYLMLERPENLSARFALVFPSIEGRRTLCQTGWKTASGLGVKFENDPFASEKAPFPAARSRPG
jgi:hypothetical protein